MMIKILKEDFLKRTRVDSRDSAMSNSIQAALQHNPTYLPNVSTESRRCFRDAFATSIYKQSQRYRFGVAEHEHLAGIEEITKKISQEHGKILRNNCLRIGTTQKALNLYLKFLWCLETDWVTPPHCPIDRIVLQKARIVGKWTQLNSIDQYVCWISQLKDFAKGQEYTNLAEWELTLWNKQA